MYKNEIQERSYCTNRFKTANKCQFCWTNCSPCACFEMSKTSIIPSKAKSSDTSQFTVREESSVNFDIYTRDVFVLCGCP